jgi:hypothetical protein
VPECDVDDQRDADAQRQGEEEGEQTDERPDHRLLSR